VITPNYQLPTPNCTRREFIATVAATTAASLLGSRLLAAQNLRFGYAAITWQGKDLDAIREISELGFPGIQLRSPILKEYGDRPAALKELLDKHKLVMVALSSGAVNIDPALEKENLELHLRHARFVKDVGGLYLQVTDTRPKRDLTPDDYKRLGRLMTEIGKRTADIGIPLGYHNHMNAIGERPDEVKWILDAADPQWVRLELDIAHYQQGGGDPVRAVREYKDRLLFLHIKDVEPRQPLAGATGEQARKYRFVELGRGNVDLQGVLKALADIRFKGWAVVELDRVPDDARTPKESAIICKRFIEALGYKIQE
jgi:inosose dehydratase